MKRILSLLIIVSALFYFTGCQPANLSGVDSASPTPSSDMTVSPSSQIILPASPSPIVAPKLVELPIPTADMFQLEGVYATLFDASVDYFYHLRDPEWVRIPNDLYIPYLSLYGFYESEGKSVFIVSYTLTCYYNYTPGETVRVGGKTIPAQIILSQAEDGQYQLVSFEEAGDGGIMEPLKRFCGPLTDLPQQILNETAERINIFPEPEEMLRMYCEATGIEVNSEPIV